MATPTEITIHQIDPGSANQVLGVNNAGSANEWKTLQGTTNQITITEGVGTKTFSTPQDIALSSSPTFASETLTNTTDQLVLGITRTVTISATQPASSSRTYTIPDQGAAANFVLDQSNYTISGTWNFAHSITLQNQSATVYQDLSVSPKSVTIEAPDTISSSYILKLPIAQSTGTQYLADDGSGNLSWNTLVTGVSSITGTANEILVNGTSGSPTGGAITLTTPQAIATTSSPTFSSLTLTTSLSLGDNDKIFLGSSGTYIDYNSTVGSLVIAVDSTNTSSGNISTPGLLTISSDVHVDNGGSGYPKLYMGAGILAHNFVIHTETGTQVVIADQSGGFNDSTSAIVAIQSATQGFLPPRMVSTDRTSISSPAEGLEVYDSTLHLPNFYNGTSWFSIATLEGNQTFTGTDIFSSAVTITPITNQLVLGVTRTVTLNAPTPAVTSRTVTVPDLSADYSVVGTAGSQTINGNKTFGGTTAFNGEVDFNSDAAFTSTTNSTVTGSNANIATHPTTYIRLSNGSLVSVGSIDNTSVVDGHIIILENATGNPITIVNNYVSAPAGQAIINGYGTNILLPNLAHVILLYDITLTQWEVVSNIPQNLATTASPTFVSPSFTTLTLTQTTGTAPLTVSSTTEVANFNAQKWHGQTYPLGSQGDIFYGGVSGVATALTVGTAHQVIHGGAIPTYGTITEADITLSNVTTNNATTAQHGFLPQLSNNATQFLNGQGIFTTVSAGAAAGYLAQSFASQTSVNVVHNFNGYPEVQVLDAQSSPNVLIPLSIVHNSVNDYTVNFDVSQSGTILTTLGSQSPNGAISTQIANYLITANDSVILANASITVTLPTAVGIAGRKYFIKNIFASSSSETPVTVATTSSQTIDGSSTIILTSQYDSIQVVSDSANWFIL